MELATENIEKDHIGRIVLLEKMVGDKVSVAFQKKSIIASENKDHPYIVRVEGEDVPEGLGKALSHLVAPMAKEEMFKRFEMVFTRIEPGNKYVIPFPVYILVDVILADDVENVMGPIDVMALSEGLQLHRISGVAHQPIRELAPGMAVSLAEGSDDFEEYKERIRTGWSKFVAPGYYPEWTAKLGTCDNKEEKELEWTI